MPGIKVNLCNGRGTMRSIACGSGNRKIHNSGDVTVKVILKGVESCLRRNLRLSSCS